MWISVYTVSVRFVPEGEGSRTRRGRVIVSLLRYRLIGIGVSLARWGGTTLSGICAILRHATLAARILDYSDFQL